MSLSEAQIDAIEAAAAAAVDRREMRCQVAMAEHVYHAAGVLPALEVAQGPRDWARASDRSLIAAFVDECPYFESVFDRASGGSWRESAQPGDLLGFRLGHTLHHVAVLLRRGRMVHVFAEHGIKIAPCIPAAWEKRIERVWRIK